jgi:hypothetical protein
MSATQNGPDIRYVKPINYPWALGALHTVLDVIRAKPKVLDNLPIATILFFPVMVCWSRNAFGILGNPSSGYLLDRAFTIEFEQNPSNVPF